MKKILLLMLSLFLLNMNLQAQLTDSYNVNLLSIGPDRAGLIAALQSEGLSNSAIKTLLEGVPKALGTNVTYENAYKVWKLFASAGATVSITSKSGPINSLKWGVYLKQTPSPMTPLSSFLSSELGMSATLVKTFISLAPHVMLTFDNDKYTEAQELTDKLNAIDGVMAICLLEVDKFVGMNNFNAAAFLKCVQPYDLDKNGMLDSDERAAVTELNIPGKSIPTLSGIELFGNLQTLDCSGNNLSSLNLSNNKSLTRIYCYNNPITDTAIDNFVASLPEVEGGELYAYDASIEGAGVNLTEEQAQTAKAKGWTAYYRQSSDSEWIAYVQEKASLYLESYPAEYKLSVVKIVKEVLGLGLKEAKDLVDAAPCYLIENGDPELVRTLKEQLEAIGCVVVVNGYVPPIQSDFYEVELQSPESAKLAIIKIIKEATGLDLVDAKALVDYAPSVVLSGVTEEVAQNLTDSIAAAGGKARYYPIEMIYDVYLTDAANSKLAVVKAIKEALSLGLKEAKDLADTAPASIFTTSDREAAQQVLTALLAAGDDVKASMFPRNNLGLRVRGAAVSYDNMNNLCGGLISYNPAEMMFTLKENITSSGHLLTNLEVNGLNIRFDKDVTVTGLSNTSIFVLNDNTNITGDGVLTLISTLKTSQIDAASAKPMKLTLDHAILKVIGVDGNAIKGNSNSSLEINGGTLITNGPVSEFSAINLSESELYYPMTGTISDGSVMIGTALVDTMVISPTQYKLNVLEIPVTGQNAQDIFGKSKKMYIPSKNDFITYTPDATGLASYDAKNNVLSLKNVNGVIDEYSAFCLYNYIPDLTINVVGDNSLESKQWTGIFIHPDAGGLTINGTGSLEVKSATWALSMNATTDHYLNVKGGVQLSLEGESCGLDGGVRETRTGQILSYHTNLNVETDTTVVKMKGGSNAARNLKALTLNDGLAITEPEGASFANYSIRDAEGNPYANTWVVISKKADEPAPIPGDVNEDTEVNINDVVAIINVMAGTASWPNANVNGDPDGAVDINDVVAVINIMAGK